MKKRKYLLILLILLMAISCSFGVITASAYTVKYDKEEGENYYEDGIGVHIVKGWDNNYGLAESKLESGPFYMLPGAAVSAFNENVLAFTLFCKDENYVNFTRTLDQIMGRGITITLLRQRATNLKYTEESTYELFYQKHTDTLSITNVQDELYGGANPFSPVLSLESENFEEIKDFGFKKVDSELASAYGWTEGDYYLRLYWQVDSPYQQYRVLFRYADYMTEKVPKKFLGIKIGEETIIKQKDYVLLSDVRSYYQILDAINQAGKVEEEFAIDLQDYVYDVLGATDQTFTVEYLENIDKTPFARKVQKQINIKALPDALKLNSTDVAAALGLTNVNCLLSGCKGFTRDTSDNIFKASYYESVYLNAKTVDGKSMHYILDPNVSYYDYFNRMDKDDIISSEMMGYCFNETLRAYPELVDYSMQDVYGYFGYIVLPDTFSINQAFATLFGNELEFDGSVNMVTFKDTLTVESYNKLLKDYNYPWLSRVFNVFTGAVTQCNATHVMMYADCSTTKAYENLNGSKEIENTNGLAVNKGPEFAIKIIEDVGELNKNLLNSLLGGKKGISLAVIALAGLIVILAIKIINKQKFTRRKKK